MPRTRRPNPPGNRLRPGLMAKYIVRRTGAVAPEDTRVLVYQGKNYGQYIFMEIAHIPHWAGNRRRDGFIVRRTWLDRYEFEWVVPNVPTR